MIIMYFLSWLCGQGETSALIWKCMEYREKHRAAQQLQNNNYIDRDRALLRRYQPHSSLMSRSVVMSNGESLSFEIIFVLLDYVTPEEIIANRQVSQHQGEALYHAKVETRFNPDKKKDYPNLRSFQKSIGKILQIPMFRKRN